MDLDRQQERRQCLRALGASGDVLDETLRYTDHVFDLETIDPEVTLPLADEPMVDCWQAWVDEAKRAGGLRVLGRYLPQLRFPIRAGMRDDPAYLNATLRGRLPATDADTLWSEIDDPASVELELYGSLAGHIPLITTRERQSFVALVRALGRRNEPAPVADSMGALMLAGYNNWQRIETLRNNWQKQQEEAGGTEPWREAFARLRSQKQLYQDRFILLNDGPYSAVPAADLGLDDSTWRRLSLCLRRDHECAHYLTRRLFGVMRSHLLDELVADYAGIVGAVGRFRDDWFLHFMGLEDFPVYRRGGRLENYRGEPPLSAGGFICLQQLVWRAAANLAAYDNQLPTQRSVIEHASSLIGLASLHLETLAGPEGAQRIAEAATRARRVLTSG